MSKHEYVRFTADPEQIEHLWVQGDLARRLGLMTHVRGSVSGRHRLPDVRFSQELPGGTVYWSVNRKGFFRRDDSLPSGWVQRICPRVATSFRTAE
ncbi:hypothetical protein PBI_SARFIRE_41 [Mycobacterium phage SarFire]|uniref:hypothetical protein n=1 Tax=Mycobacterium phage SarFire TaxID=1340827 RepID=UPI0003897814|nr:hypothetical protein P765_gp41 [Mycobacterium phage SarFire]AGT20572.1 hypothetical protein PBI_SARFIRE_41 [Mycobacterium phage SarFire]AJA43616.1 hypothetical protein PBI_THOR_41 [Mycobacterium phage Thor]